jgi:LysR family glycine cleavage system transcriptional activator
MMKLPLLDVDWGPEFPEFPHWADWLEHYGPATRARAPQMTFSLASASIDAAIEGRGAVLAQHSLAARALADGSLIALFDLTLPLPESYFVAWSLTAREKPAGAAFYAWLNQRRVTATKSPST